MNLLAKHSQNKEDKSTIITLGNLAKAHKQNDPEVIDATIGMLYNEDGTLFTFQSVERALQSLTPTEKYAYASTAGSVDYHEAVKRWVFQDQYDFYYRIFLCRYGNTRRQRSDFQYVYQLFERRRYGLASRIYVGELQAVCL